MPKKRKTQSQLKHAVPTPVGEVQLTRRQKAVVDAMVDGELDGEGVVRPVTVTRAAEIAGYAKGESGRTAASKTLRRPHVQAYLFQRVAEQVGLGAVGASHVLNRLALSAKSEYVQLEASKDLLDRAGFKAPEKVQHQHDVSINIDLG